VLVHVPEMDVHARSEDRKDTNLKTVCVFEGVISRNS
jgi:hypothetical protein